MASQESLRKSRVPMYILASLLTSLGGFLNGFDTGSIGSLTSMPQFQSSIEHLSHSQLGFTVSLIMLAGAVPSAFAGTLADRLGRLRVVFIGAIVFVIGATIEAAARNLITFNIGRTLAGLGEGVYLSSVSVYICEISPSSFRGCLASLPQFQATLGVCLGYFTCYASVHVPSSLAWRTPFIVQALLGVVLAGSCFVLPDSPRWLIHHGKLQEGSLALARLHYPLAEAERDILRPNTDDQRPSLTAWQSLLLIFRRGYRARTILALFVLGMVQLSGIDGVLYYAPTLFTQAGLPGQTASFLASGLSAILMLAISIPAFLFADRWGRRTSALTGGLSMAACMLLMGSLYAARAVHAHGPARWVVVAAVFWFSLTYCATWGIVGKMYASEIQPGHTRAAANCVAQGLGFLANWLVAILTPVLLGRSAYGAYFLFGGLALGTVAVLAVWMPETRGRSLESIQEGFQRPVGKGWRAILKGSAVDRKEKSQPASDAVSLVSMRTALSEGPAMSVATTGGLRVEISAV